MQVRVLLVLIFELKFCDDFVELAIKGDEEGDLLDQIEQAAHSFGVLNRDTFGVLFEGDHDVLKCVGLDKFVQRQSCIVNLIAIHVSNPLRLFSQVIRTLEIQHDLV